MANTPGTQCKDCDRQAHWRIATTDRGPVPTSSVRYGFYCLPDAYTRAEALRPQWEARHQARRAASAAAHAAWLAHYHTAKGATA